MFKNAVTVFVFALVAASSVSAQSCTFGGTKNIPCKEAPSGGIECDESKLGTANCGAKGGRWKQQLYQCDGGSHSCTYEVTYVSMFYLHVWHFLNIQG